MQAPEQLGSHGDVAGCGPDVAVGDIGVGCSCCTASETAAIIAVGSMGASQLEVAVGHLVDGQPLPSPI